MQPINKYNFQVLNLLGEIRPIKGKCDNIIKIEKPDNKK